MSLTPQRPNFVLIWIGIVMLSFSLAGNWILGSSTQETRSLGDSARLSLNFEDTHPLSTPVFLDEKILSVAPVFLSEAFDQMVPLREPGSFGEVSILAAHTSPIPTLFSEVLQDSTAKDSATEKAAQAEEAQGLGTSTPESSSAEPQKLFHSLEWPAKSKAKGKARSSHPDTTSGNVNSRWGRSHNNLAKAAQKSKAKGRAIRVRTLWIPTEKNRVLVRLLLDHPGSSSAFKDLDAAKSQLAMHAEKMLDTLLEVVRPQLGKSTEQEIADQKQRERLQAMRNRLLQSLKQRPGGIELVAELSPQQVEELLQKLSARNA